MGEEMKEEIRDLIDYEEKYWITVSGRIICKKNNHVRHKNGNVYGYKHVHLHKNGTRKLFSTFDVWKKNFPDKDPSTYKGIK
ncbi:hypothetical protein NRS6110_04052 [Bacillus subtilis]|uniref:3-ketosteroid-delta-1-dehydrogenase n=1 Tax=Bacillus subtilis TaxID=1423 RepID=UPI0008C3B48E|nr:hypothetical protein BDW29_2221 [Bacillus sp. AtDRG31]WIT27112.1 hypothetical protein [Bacillus phage SPbetaL2]CAF1781657.1 hypothetical protein NRS6111_03811 [Bacillus subtilis]CAF1784313.1 hypothetical protein NRS6110_04052 [Bacillus subtilis]CAF1855256.1 hypothetical protein NRS6160_03903 [Bacillus subtilis]